ncbi:MAG: response regulator [Elusimicrobia bacterium]|nr:response regulator [Elusimicrobiota bacterium]MBI3013219.1 response regulator [Elusimicrobiota bacterium]
MKQVKALVVDDDHEIADLLKMNLNASHFLAKSCYGGIEALKELEKDLPDILILDVVMPKMDGWEVLQNIKSNAKTSSLPVIMCTAKDQVGDVEKSFHYGAQSFVMKPIVFDKLLKKIGAILDIEELLHG